MIYYAMLICVAIEAVITYIYFEDNYDNRFCTWQSLLIGNVVFLAPYSILLWVKPNFFIANMILYFLVTVLYASCSYRISFKSALFHSAILTVIMIATELIVETIFSVIYNDFVFAFMDSQLQNALKFIVFAVLSKLLMLMTVKLISSFYSYKKNNAIGDMKRTYLISLVPMLISLFIVLFFHIAAHYQLPRWLVLVIFVLCLVSLAICCFIYVYMIKIQRDENELLTLQAEQRKNEMDIQYLNLLEERNHAMQILTHDYKNHLYAIRNLSGSEQTEYIDRVADELQSSRTSCHSGNHTLDIIINKYVTECAMRNVTFEFEVKITNLSTVSDYDLVTILGNLLDNALEASQQSEAKAISFKTNKINTYDSFVITNSCDTPPDKDLKTTKQNKKLHGVGLKSVTKTLKQYGGELEWEYNSDRREFITTVILLEKAI